jgi:hypothetical protein
VPKYVKLAMFEGKYGFLLQPVCIITHHKVEINRIRIPLKKRTPLENIFGGQETWQVQVCEYAEGYDSKTPTWMITFDPQTTYEEAQTEVAKVHETYEECEEIERFAQMLRQAEPRLSLPPHKPPLEIAKENPELAQELNRRYEILREERSARFKVLILFSVQSNINNPVKTGEGLDLCGCGFQLSEAAFQRGFDGVHRKVIVVAKGLRAHLPPDQFLRIALRTVRRQPVHRDIVRHDQRFGLMPARTIHKHQDVLLGMPPGDLGQIKRHGRSIGVWQNQADQFAILRTDTAKDVRIFPHPMRRHFGPTAWRCPTPDRIAHPSKPGFILEHQAQRLAGVSSRDRVHFGLKFF